MIEEEDIKPSPGGVSDDDLESIVGDLRAAERAARTRTAIIGVAALIVITGVLYWMVHNTADLFRPNLDVDEGERLLEEDTGDPVCRGLLFAVDEAADDFRDREMDFERHIWGDDEERLDQLRETATAFRSRLDRAAATIDDAVFREEGIRGHPPVPKQVGEWFSNMDNEFRILEEMADRRLRMIRGEEVEERGGLWEEPEDLRDRVLLTIDENFEEFRVWVARGGHPCGAPPPGVEPWAGD